MVAINKQIVEWILDPSNYETGLRILSINGLQVPIVRPCCKLCTDMNIWKKVNTLSDAKIIKYTKQGKLHGLKRPLAVMENEVYHKPCLQKKLGKKYNQLVAQGIIIEEE